MLVAENKWVQVEKLRAVDTEVDNVVPVRGYIAAVVVGDVADSDNNETLVQADKSILERNAIEVQ